MAIDWEKVAQQSREATEKKLADSVDYTKPGSFFTANLPGGYTTVDRDYGVGIPKWREPDPKPVRVLTPEEIAEIERLQAEIRAKAEEGRLRREAEAKTAAARLKLSNEFTTFVSLVKKIVLLWAENLDDSELRVAMLELREAPIRTASPKTSGQPRAI